MASLLSSPKAKRGLLIFIPIVVAAGWYTFYAEDQTETTISGKKNQIQQLDKLNELNGINNSNIKELRSEPGSSLQEAESLTESGNFGTRVITNPSASSIYPEDPLQHYVDNIGAALADDRDAQYEVIRALEECRSARNIPRDELVNELLLKTSVTDELREEILSMHDFCLSLAMEVGDIDKQRQSWVTKARDMGHPVILAREAMIDWAQNRHQDYIDRATTFRNTLIPSLQTNAAESYSQISAYFVNVFPEEFLVEREAWGYLSCQANPTCDTVAFKVGLSDRLPEYNIDVAIGLAAEYENDIARGNFDADLIPEPRILPPVPDHIP